MEPGHPIRNENFIGPFNADQLPSLDVGRCFPHLRQPLASVSSNVLGFGLFILASVSSSASCKGFRDFSAFSEKEETRVLLRAVGHHDAFPNSDLDGILSATKARVLSRRLLQITYELRPRTTCRVKHAT